MTSAVQLTAIFSSPTMMTMITLSSGVVVFSFFKLSEWIYQSLVVWWAYRQLNTLRQTVAHRVPSHISMIVTKNMYTLHYINRVGGSNAVVKRVRAIKRLVRKHLK